MHLFCTSIREALIAVVQLFGHVIHFFNLLRRSNTIYTTPYVMFTRTDIQIKARSYYL